MIDDRPQIILICGVTGSGKTTFPGLLQKFVPSILCLPSPSTRAFPGESFCCETNLTNQTQFTLLGERQNAGLQNQSLLSFHWVSFLLLARARVRKSAKGEPFDEALFKRTYESSYKGLLIFTIMPKSFSSFATNPPSSFLSAYEPSSTPKPTFVRMVKQIKSSVDNLR
jgi:hypothetical protein